MDRMLTAAVPQAQRLEAEVAAIPVESFEEG